VVDISVCGALLEGLTRLLPNTHTDVHIVTRHGRVLVRSRVVRAFVWRLEREMVCYRTALAFDTPVDVEPPRENSESAGPEGAERVEGYELPVEIAGNQRGAGSRYPSLEDDDRV
jgi:hypothetical protein